MADMPIIAKLELADSRRWIASIAPDNTCYRGVSIKTKLGRAIREILLAHVGL
jgi:hypothetical protein